MKKTTPLTLALLTAAGFAHAAVLPQYTLAPLAEPEGALASYVNAINAHGGRGRGVLTTASGDSGSVWRAGATQPAILPGADSASAINASGVVVGYYHKPSALRAYACKWRPGTTVPDALKDPHPFTDKASIASAINDADLVVGYYTDGGRLFPCLHMDWPDADRALRGGRCGYHRLPVYCHWRECEGLHRRVLQNREHHQRVRLDRRPTHAVAQARRRRGLDIRRCH